MNNTTFVKDTAAGILTAVLGLFLVYLSWYCTGFVPIWEWALALVFAYAGRIVIGVGYLIFKGMDIPLE